MSQAAVRYRSSRAPAGERIDFDTALRRGLAPDGGLYVPERIPAIAEQWYEAADWPSLIAAVLGPWFEPEDDAASAVTAAQAALDFAVPVRMLSDDTALLELHHGPTLAFKDVAARTMARWLGRSLAQRGERATIVVATSGDTGGAVADGFAGVPGIEVVVLYPAGRVSPVQERQLTLPRQGVFSLAVEGDFDACQRLVKGALVDPALAHLHVSSANSINIGRLLPQMTYHLWGALQASRLSGRPLERVVNVVPSGNLGNLTAGVLAVAMGAQLAGFVAAHNANDHYPRLLQHADASVPPPATIATLSNAMDVGAPSNLERLTSLFPTHTYPRPIVGASIEDAATLEAMRTAWDTYGVVVCPHTAVGLEAWRRVQAAAPHWQGALGLVFATAHPAKFPEVVARALPGVDARHPALESLPPARPHAHLAASEAAFRGWLLAHVSA